MAVTAFNQQSEELSEDGGDFADSLRGVDANVRAWLDGRNTCTLQGALAFVPWVLQQAYKDGGLDEGQIVIHRGTGAVVFSDASGFTALTETLAKKGNGAELLSHCLTSFFTPLIDLIHAYRGDVIKFSGDALTVYLQAIDDTKWKKRNRILPPHGTYGLPDLGPMATAVLRASACCIEIHKRLHMFDTGIDDLRLSLHIGVGCGKVSVMQVGGVVPPETHVPRVEYIIAGPPLEQIAVAEPLAKHGETCLSPQAWEYVKDCVIEGPPIDERPDYHLLLRMDESKYTFPTIKHAAIENDNRSEKSFGLKELNVLRRYIPSTVFKQIECATLSYVNEMRTISVIFISGSGLDVMTDRGANKAQELVSSIQRSCYAHEGTLNKFLIDDKGMLFLMVFGLPPLVHTDDPTRAVLTSFDMVKVFRRLELIGKFGVTTGRSFCGLCGSAKRMEYTVLGDYVNLSARLMSNAPNLGILCDEDTKLRATTEVCFHALAPIKVKGKSNSINVFQPVPKEQAQNPGLGVDKKIRYPWWDFPFGGTKNPTGTLAKTAQQTNMQQMCAVKSWDGILKATALLGATFQLRSQYEEEVPVPGAVPGNTPIVSTPGPPPPPSSPFTQGGVVVCFGDTGIGRIELAEHMISYAAFNFQMMPVFGTMGPRPGDSTRLSMELLKSTLCIFRHLNPAVPVDDFQALAQVVPPPLAGHLPMMRQALESGAPSSQKGGDILDTALDVIIGLLQMLVKLSSVCMVLQFEYGTSLFPQTLEDLTTFWKVVTKLSKLIKPAGSDSKPLVMMILAAEADRTNQAVQKAIQTNSLIHLVGLNEDDLLEYMSSYLGVPVHMVPQALRMFVSKVTSGNPMYVRETIDMLQETTTIAVNWGANNTPKNLECKDLGKLDIASWIQTAMVGTTVCLIQSLDPMEIAVLKMSTVFVGPFTLPDLAASICSRWADATHFDLLRLYKALRTLVERDIVAKVAAPSGTDGSPMDENSQTLGTTEASLTGAFSTGSQFFQMRNLLIRAVGGAMVLEAQRKAVKRQALIDRALNRSLPGRMEALNAKKGMVHIPWYYEQAFRRM